MGGEVGSVTQLVLAASERACVSVCVCVCTRWLSIGLMKGPGALEAEAKASNLWLSRGAAEGGKACLLKSNRDALPGAGAVGSAAVTACRGGVG